MKCADSGKISQYFSDFYDIIDSGEITEILMDEVNEDKISNIMTIFETFTS